MIVASLGWKTTFYGRKPSMEEDLWWKTIFDERQPLLEHNLWWKTFFNGGRPFMEDNFWWKTTFHDRWCLVEDNLKRKDNNGWKTIFHWGIWNKNQSLWASGLLGWYIGQFRISWSKAPWENNPVPFEVYTPMECSSNTSSSFPYFFIHYC